MAIIQITNLTKKYGDLIAVDGVNLEIEEGECFGLLGPNGAGKTTLIRMITAISPPSDGTIRVLNKDLSDHARQIKKVLGVIPQIDNLDSDLTVFQNLMTFARYFDIPKNEARKRSIEGLKLFQLEEKSKSKINELSGGMKRRLLIARGLINTPRVVILDEPSIGLDPQSRHLVWQKLLELKSQGITQILCTQNMDEAYALCDRVAVMHQGKILSLDTPRKLISRYTGDEVWEIGINGKNKEIVLKELKNQNIDFDVADDKIHVFHADSDDVIKKLLHSTDRMWRRPATLEDVFFRLTGRSLSE
jgi:lipooligosaccharide transport system ATP-binding protein